MLVWSIYCLGLWSVFLKLGSFYVSSGVSVFVCLCRVVSIGLGFLIRGCGVER